MAWRGLHLSDPCRLSLADGQCVIAREGGEIRLALEDIAWIIVDTPQVTLTAALLSACMEVGIALIVTDARHHPSGLALPFHRHYRQAEVAARQVALTAETRGLLWRALARAKIRNQAAALALCGDAKGAAPLRAMAGRVAPGDPDNIAAEGVTHLTTIHDSFGTHAADTTRLGVILREQFAAIYAHDWLQRLHADFSALAPTLELPAPPARGSWNPQDVLRSSFAFG